MLHYTSFADYLPQKTMTFGKIRFGVKTVLSFRMPHLAVLTYMLSFSSITLAQTTWQGDISNNWHLAGNWSAGVPDASDAVIISSVTPPNVAPVVTSAALAAKVDIVSGGSLTIAQGGTLSISGSGNSGLDISGSVENNGALAVNNVGTSGINVRAAAHFINKGTINIGNTADIGSSGIDCRGTFVNESGSIYINRTGRATSSIAGIIVDGSFTNKANISVGEEAPGLYKGSGIWSMGDFSNEAGGVISISRAFEHGLKNWDSFTNKGSVSIGTSGNIRQNGIYNSGTFNNSSGTINVDKTTQAALYNDSGTFTNSAALSLKTSATATFLVDSFEGTISNGTTGTLSGAGVINSTHFTNNGGSLSPGYSPGKLIFNGDENFANSTMAIEVNGTGVAGTNYDQVFVYGAATLGGALALTFNAPAPNEGDAVTIVDATTLSGTFSSVTGLPAKWTVKYNTPIPGRVSLVYSNALPVTLIRFTAKKLDSNVRLDWQTSSEINNQGFDIERRHDAGEWETIGFIDGNGSVKGNTSYSFRDTKPLSGMNYYRLRQLDLNGDAEFSRIVDVKIDGENMVKIYPNPTTGIINIEGAQAGVKIVDVFGRSVLNGTAVNQKIDVSGLPAGLYIMSVSSKNGEKSFSILKQ